MVQHPCFASSTAELSTTESSFRNEPGQALTKIEVLVSTEKYIQISGRGERDRITICMKRSAKKAGPDGIIRRACWWGSQTS